MTRRGVAALPALKVLAMAAAFVLALPVARYAYQIAAGVGGNSDVWTVLIALGPFVLGLIAWAFKDAGDLRTLIGRFEGAGKVLDKVDDGQERVFRELGALDGFVKETLRRFAAVEGDVKQQDQFRHDLRDELAPKILNSQSDALDAMKALEERIRALETEAASRRGRRGAGASR